MVFFFFASFASKITNREIKKTSLLCPLPKLFSLTKRVPHGDLARAGDRTRDEILRVEGIFEERKREKERKDEEKVLPRSWSLTPNNVDGEKKSKWELAHNTLTTAALGLVEAMACRGRSRRS